MLRPERAMNHEIQEVPVGSSKDSLDPVKSPRLQPEISRSSILFLTACPVMIVATSLLVKFLAKKFLKSTDLH